MIYDIPNCRYNVDDQGRLFIKKTGEEKHIKPNSRGYIKITVNGKKVFLHRIIATAFIPNPENKPFVDHINRITWDNRVTNLRWVTHKENMNNIPFNLPPELRIDALGKSKYFSENSKRYREKQKAKAIKP